MANTKEIQTRMRSIQDTMKITNAMYMISSSKLKKAKKSLEASTAHFYAIQGSIARILRHVPDIENIYFGTETDQKRVGYIVVTADKGLAGAYNQNVIKLVQKELDANPQGELFVVGQIGRNYFEKKGYKIHRHFQYTAQNPSIHRARVIAEEILVRYNEGKLDEVYIVYTRSINGMDSEAEMFKLLPLSKADFSMNNGMELMVSDTTRYLPTPNDVMNAIVPNYVTGYIYGALVESFACEQNDRMMAMDAATGNATDMLKSLSIEYNRVRQAAITQEITEVIAGAKAQKRKKSNG
jgi:F-type H+-transporting ATPase subunit gamma